MRRRGDGGFTLLEVLVATMIMAISVGALMSAISTAMNNAARLTERDRALILARQKMDELLITKDLPKDSMVEGRWDPALTGGVASGWQSQMTYFEMPQDAVPGMAVLERLRLEVWWGEGSARRTFTLEGFRRGEIPIPVAGP